MEIINETELIWSGIKGAQELYALYGHYPTLHDAKVTNVITRFVQKSISLIFEYNDLFSHSEPDRRSLTTRFTMRWLGVTQASLKLENNDASRVSFSKVCNLIQTVFDSYVYGFDGIILAEQIEVVEVVEWNVVPNDDDVFLRLEFSA